LDLVESAELSELFSDLPRDVIDKLTGEETAANSQKCLPYIKPVSIDMYNGDQKKFMSP